MSEPEIPSSDWQNWGRARTKAKRGPQWGPAAFVRAIRLPGSLHIRCVTDTQAVVAWRPVNPLLQTTISYCSRPRILLGQAVSLQLRDHPWGLTFWGTPVPVHTRTSAGQQLVLAPAVAHGWTNPDERWVRSWS